MQENFRLFQPFELFKRFKRLEQKHIFLRRFIMQRGVALILFLILISVSDGWAEEIIKKGETLSLQRCVEIGLMRQPDILAAAGAIDVNRSRVGQSKANYYPQVNASGSYSKISPVSGGAASGSSSGTRNSFDQYSSSVSLSQNIYDFGKTSTQVEIQNLNLDSALSDLENVSAQIVFNVKQAYYGVLSAKRNVAVAADSVKQFQLHLEQAQGFFDAGTKPRFDVTKALVDLGNAKLNLITAENAVKISRVVLNNAMGVPDAPEYEIEDNLDFIKYEIAFENALNTAYMSRPDLRSLIAKRQAAENAIELAVKNYYPALSGNASYNWSGEKFPLQDGWQAGITLSVPIFSGFLTRYQVEESKANLNVIKANEEALRQTVLLDVQQSYLNLRQAEEKIYASELNVKQAEENFEIANGRYAAGVGSPIEVTDAEVSLINAKTAYNQALYDHKVALASLEKAMGAR
jgi:outer membrane protein TolC